MPPKRTAQRKATERAQAAPGPSRRPTPQTVAPVPPPPPAPAPPPLPQPAPRRTGRTLLLAVLLAGVGCGVALTLFLLRGGEGDRFVLRLGAPTAVSVKQLHEFASPARPVYWLGPPQLGQLEVTRTARGAVFVRYLPVGVGIGDRSAAYTTIATYAVPDAYATLTRSARTPGNAHAIGAKGALAVWPLARPTSVYLAAGGSDYLVEVYDPSPRRARALAVAGSVRRVR